MAIARDSISAGVAAEGISELSWSHTVGSASNRMLVVCAAVSLNTTPTVTGVVWDSGGADTPLSNTVNSVAASQVNGGDGFSTAYLWYLLAPASGTKTIKVTANTACEMNTGAESLSGVHQSSTFNAASPEGNSRASAINPTTTVTTANGEWVIDSVSMSLAGDVSPTVGASQDVIYSTSVGPNTSNGFASDESAGGATTVMDWTGLEVSQNAGTGQICVSLVPAASAGHDRLLLRRFP
jgi:hypothetical protein